MEVAFVDLADEQLEKGNAVLEPELLIPSPQRLYEWLEDNRDVAEHAAFHRQPVSAGGGIERPANVTPVRKTPPNHRVSLRGEGRAPGSRCKLETLQKHRPSVVRERRQTARA